MDDGLVLKKDMIMSEINVSLNPYCSGQWSRTFSPQFLIFGISSLNPCCSGRRSRTGSSEHFLCRKIVLILVVVDYGLVLSVIDIANQLVEKS